jgi:hypothetical protein
LWRYPRFDARLAGTAHIASRSYGVVARRLYPESDPLWFLPYTPYYGWHLGYGHSRIYKNHQRVTEGIVHAHRGRPTLGLEWGIIGQLATHLTLTAGVQGAVWPHIKTTTKEARYISTQIYGGLAFVF